jgi:putative membrane protein
VLVVYHIWCGKLMLDFRNERSMKSHVWFRWFNEFPVLILVAIVLLVVFKPF